MFKSRLDYESQERHWGDRRAHQGATVQIVRDPVGEHVKEAVVRLRAIVDYLSDRFGD